MNDFEYTKRYLKSSFSKIVSVFILAITAITSTIFSVGVSSNLIVALFNSTKFEKADINTYILILVVVSVIIFIFSAFLIYNSYFILFKGREREFFILHSLGMSNKRIKKLIIQEFIVVLSISYLCSIFLGFTITIPFLIRANITFDFITVIPLLGISFLFIIIIFYLCLVAYKNSKKETVFQDSKQTKVQLITTVLGILLMIGSQMNEKLDFLFIVGIILCIVPIFNVSLLLLNKLAIKLNRFSLYLAVNQIKYYFKNFKSIISSLVLAIILFVGMMSFYESMQKSVIAYFNDNIKYDYLVQLEGLIDKNQIIEELNIDQDDYSTGLILPFKDKKDEKLLYGVNENYNQFEKLLISDNLYNSMNKGEMIRVVTPNETYKKMNEIQVLDSKLKVVNIGMYKSFVGKQVLISQSKLSQELFGTPNMINVIWVKNVDESKMNILSKELNIKNSMVDKTSLVSKTTKQVINGTEAIELFLYIYLIFSSCLIINIFILFYQNRKEDYTILMRLNISRDTIVKSIVYESLIVNIFSWLVGVPAGIAFVKGALDVMAAPLNLPVNLYIAGNKTIIVGLLCFILTILSAVFVTWKSLVVTREGN